jgi:hypothetical protein
VGKGHSIDRNPNHDVLCPGHTHGLRRLEEALKVCDQLLRKALDAIDRIQTMQHRCLQRRPLATMYGFLYAVIAAQVSSHAGDSTGVLAPTEN